MAFHLMWDVEGDAQKALNDLTEHLKQFNINWIDSEKLQFFKIKNNKLDLLADKEYNLQSLDSIIIIEMKLKELLDTFKVKVVELEENLLEVSKKEKKLKKERTEFIVNA